MRLLPPSTVPQRVVCFSIALPEKSTTPAAGWERAVRRYLELFREFNLRATWGLKDLATIDAEPFRAAAHELALSGDAAWLGSGEKRLNLRSHLQRQLSVAEPKQIKIGSVVMRDAMLSKELDALVRAGISIVASDRPIAAGRRTHHPVRTLRFGLWEMQASLLVSLRAGRMGGFSLRRRVDRIMSADGVCHVALTADVDTDRSALRTVEGLLRHVAGRRADNSLEVLTMTEIARQLPSRRCSRSAQSILRSDEVARAA